MKKSFNQWMKERDARPYMVATLLLAILAISMFIGIIQQQDAEQPSVGLSHAVVTGIEPWLKNLAKGAAILLQDVSAALQKFAESNK